MLINSFKANLRGINLIAARKILDTDPNASAFWDPYMVGAVSLSSDDIAHFNAQELAILAYATQERVKYQQSMSLGGML